MRGPWGFLKNWSRAQRGIFRRWALETIETKAAQDPQTGVGFFTGMLTLNIGVAVF